MSAATSNVSGVTASTTELSDRDRSILEFERMHWRHRGLKDTAVLTIFGLSWVRYVQVLHAILDQPAAEVYDPVTVRRLRRLRDARAAVRSRAKGFSID
mgnify:CR=1 FL=1